MADKHTCTKCGAELEIIHWCPCCDEERKLASLESAPTMPGPLGREEILKRLDYWGPEAQGDVAAVMAQAYERIQIDGRSLESAPAAFPFDCDARVKLIKAEVALEWRTGRYPSKIIEWLEFAVALYEWSKDHYRESAPVEGEIEAWGEQAKHFEDKLNSRAISEEGFIASFIHDQHLRLTNLSRENARLKAPPEPGTNIIDYLRERGCEAYVNAYELQEKMVDDYLKRAEKAEAEVASLKAVPVEKETEALANNVEAYSGDWVIGMVDGVEVSGRKHTAAFLRSQARTIAGLQADADEGRKGSVRMLGRIQLYAKQRDDARESIQSLERRTEKADELASAAQALDALDTPSANERYEIALAAYKDSVKGAKP